MRQTGPPQISLNLFVDDLSLCKEFYDRIFGVRVIHEDSVCVAFVFHEALIYLMRDAEAAKMIAPLRVGRQDCAPRMVLSLLVADVDDVYEAATNRGLEPICAPTDRPWGARAFTFTDPAGHCWEIAQSISVLSANPPEIDTSQVARKPAEASAVAAPYRAQEPVTVPSLQRLWWNHTVHRQ